MEFSRSTWSFREADGDSFVFSVDDTGECGCEHFQANMGIYNSFAELVSLTYIINVRITWDNSIHLFFFGKTHFLSKKNLI